MIEHAANVFKELPIVIVTSGCYTLDCTFLFLKNVCFWFCTGLCYAVLFQLGLLFTVIAKGVRSFVAGEPSHLLCKQTFPQIQKRAQDLVSARFIYKVIKLEKKEVCVLIMV